MNFTNPNRATLTGFAHEQLTVSNTALGFTSATYKPGTGGNARRAFVTCHQGAIRYMYHGGNPTASTGHMLSDGGVLSLEGEHQIDNFKAIRTGNVDAVLEVTFERV